MKLYYYDHCPYCVKARMVFGLKNLPIELVPVLNDDVETPTKLVGKKVVPILVKEDGTAMPESMDIVRYIDSQFGQPIITGESRAEVVQWLDDSRAYLNRLCMPRWVQLDLPEFKTQSARDHFQAKKEELIGYFVHQLRHTDVLRAQAEDHLLILEKLMMSDSAVNGELSEDDFHVFATLRSLSVVKGLRFPPKLLSYMNTMSAKSGVGLYTGVGV